MISEDRFASAVPETKQHPDCDEDISAALLLAGWKKDREGVALLNYFSNSTR